jgi:hypothetical protein
MTKQHEGSIIYTNMQSGSVNLELIVEEFYSIYFLSSRFK